MFVPGDAADYGANPAECFWDAITGRTRTDAITGRVQYSKSRPIPLVRTVGLDAFDDMVPRCDLCLTVSGTAIRSRRP